MSGFPFKRGIVEFDAVEGQRGHVHECPAAAWDDAIRAYIDDQFGGSGAADYIVSGCPGCVLHDQNVFLPIRQGNGRFEYGPGYVRKLLVPPEDTLVFRLRFDPFLAI